MTLLAILERHNPALRGPVTVAELYALADSGELGPEDRVELIDGEIIPMSPKYNKHEVIKRALDRWLQRNVDDDTAVSVEMSLTLSDTLLFEPDICAYPDAMLPQDVRGPDILLVIEIADSSLSTDVGVKARRYAEHGVCEYWVIDAERREMIVFRGCSPLGYLDRQRFARGEQVEPLRLRCPPFSLGLLKLPPAAWA